MTRSGKRLAVLSILVAATTIAAAHTAGPSETWTLADATTIHALLLGQIITITAFFYSLED